MEISGTRTRLPESPRVPMEFLSRSWSASAVEISESLPSHISMLLKVIPPSNTPADAVPEHITGTGSEDLKHSALSVTSKRVLDRILSKSLVQLDVSPLNSGRPSLSSEPIYLKTNTNIAAGGGGGDSCNDALTGGTATASPSISPPQDFNDVVKVLRVYNTQQPQFHGGRSTTTTITNGGGKTVGRWLKDRKEKKKEETRAHTAQLHAAISVAGVAAAIAAIAAGSENKKAADTAVASAAMLVAAQCVEAAEALGAERDHLESVISSAVNVRCYDDVVTLTAAAATALRGAATLKARALKDVVWNMPPEIPLQKPIPTPRNGYCNNNHIYNGDLDGYNQEFLARGCELLKRTRKGDLHWKIVSVYLHRSGQVMLKMKSRHVAGTITKKKKNVVLEVYKDMPAWPRRHSLEGSEQCYYFGLKTELRGIVEFECRNQKEHDLWTQGVLNLLSIVAEKKYRCQA